MKNQTADDTMCGTSPVPGGQRGRRRLTQLVAALGAAALSLFTGSQVSAAMTDFEGFTTGVSVNYQGPGSTTSWYGYTIPNPYGSLWTVVDEWGHGRPYLSKVPFDETVVYDETGTNKVWRLSNAIADGSYSDQPNALSTCVAVGETNAALYNYRGTSHSSPLNPPQARAYAEQRQFHMQLRFKSATGAAQPGLGITMSAIPRQTSGRMTYLRIEDPGSGGFNLLFIGTGPGGSFPAPTTIASGLSYSTWHTLDMYIEFVDGLNPDGSGNDIVTVKLDGTTIHVGTTWETYFAAYEPVRSPLAVDTVMFRSAGTAVPSTLGNGFFFDDVIIEVPDTTAPTITCPSDVTVNADAGQCYATSVSLGTPVTSDNASPSCSSVTVSNDAPAQIPVGTNLVTWTATDSAGNSSTCVQTVVVVDNQNPIVTCPSDVTTTAAAGQCSASVSFAATSSDNCGVASTVYAIGITPIGSPYSFPVGETTVDVTVTDVNGNTATCSFKVTVTDTEAPSVVCKDKTVYLDGSGAAGVVPADVHASSSDNCGTVTLVSVSPNSFTCANLGANSVTLTVQDASGNTATCSATVTVLDLMVPTVVCQPATVILDGTGHGSITAADVYVSSSDNCGTVNIVGVSPSSFTCADVGAHTVTLTVNDGHGNVGTCQATVTVVDNEAPVITCPPDQTLVNNLALVYTTPTATDNCPDGVTVVCSPPSGGTLTPGATTVTCTATDASGNSDSCTFTVTVTATTALIYNGVFLDVDGNGSSVLTATLSSPLAGCAVGKPILFTVMQGATIVATATANTDSGGKSTVTVPLASGVYDVIVSFAGDDECSGSSDSGVLTVASAGDSVYGGGWYKATSAPTTKASFGLVAQKKFNRKTGTYQFSGNLVWIHHKKNRLKSTSISAIGTTTVSGYAKSALVSGTGQLSSWIVDSSYLDGGYWSAPVTVEFVATVCDGGVVTVKKVPSDKPDAFGMSVGGASIALPGETAPIVLSGGSLKVN